MNWLDKFLQWLKQPAAASHAPVADSQSPTIGDRLLNVAAAWLKSQTTQAQQKAADARNAAPVDNSPGATNQAADAPRGQTLADLLRAYNQ